MIVTDPLLQSIIWFTTGVFIVVLAITVPFFIGLFSGILYAIIKCGWMFGKNSTERKIEEVSKW